MSPAASASTSYPVQLEVDPAAPQSRLTVFFRILMLIPHIIILYALGAAQGVITFIAWFAIVFTGSYPAGLFGFSVGVSRWQTRMAGYATLLTGLYPPFALDGAVPYPVRVTIADAFTGRNRLTTFFRVFMIIPHVIVLYLVQLVAGIMLFVGWFAALFTGTLPAGIHNFLSGTLRWQTRFGAYANLLTDEYPPFSLS